MWAFYLPAMAVFYLLPAGAAVKEKPGFGTGYVIESTKPRYTLLESVETAMRNYPSLRRDNATLGTTRATITVEKTAYLPLLAPSKSLLPRCCSRCC